MITRINLKLWWEWIQQMLDIDGDIFMGLFTAAVIYKLIHGGLTGADATVYASAIGCFAYSNKGGGPKQS